ncbi:Rrf2 family transcriptional regulator [Candidimonas humi]|uniref:RrF2 family transcriptional regulator n=1 Tax=Candidimonas humi TaxID=683355 RepID=A0ABV8P458_9BURK|nr:Rrf2 family transcriptional regulator [Candidimonas humi]MBV6306237.1 Rrf2 family transcriptional regulator [Candidimonas humi]
MRLTTHTDYAMRLLMYLGQHPERLCTIAEIAQAHGISEPHLMKITHRLGQQGWIHTVRGKHGGMRLAMEPSQIGLGAVLRDTESDLELVECFGTHSNCMLGGRCRLAAIVDGALQQFMRHMDGYTLADIMPQPGLEAGPPQQAMFLGSAAQLRHP